MKAALSLFAKVLLGSIALLALLNWDQLQTAKGQYHLFMSALACALLWTSNSYSNEIMGDRISWINAPLKRFALNLALTFAFTFSIWIMIVAFWNAPWEGINIQYALNNAFELGSFLPTLFITLLITVFMHGRSFLLEWRQAASEAERLKKEQIAAQYETLKSQVNPHFLFNSLNVLTALVHKDADQAEQFIRQLSKVYRYVLDSRGKETVPLQEELAQLESYIYLLKIRFGESLNVHLSVQSLSSPVAPLTLQMLVENAVKHNESSKSRPLQVNIVEKGGAIWVSNTLQPKSQSEDSSGVGLSNIKARYGFLTTEPVRDFVENGEFIVVVPLPSPASA